MKFEEITVLTGVSGAAVTIENATGAGEAVAETADLTSASAIDFANDSAVFVVSVDDDDSGTSKVTCLSCLGLFCGEMMETGFFSGGGASGAFLMLLRNVRIRSSGWMSCGVSPVKAPSKMASLFLLAISRGLSSNILRNTGGGGGGSSCFSSGLLVSAEVSFPFASLFGSADGVF